MEDLMIAKYLRDKGYDKDLSDYEFMNKHQNFREYPHMNHMHEYEEKHKSPIGYKALGLGIPTDYSEMEYKEYNTEKSGKFNESFSKYLVSNMCHYENGKKYIGEKYDKMKAKEVYERYRGLLPSNIDFHDIYLAINSQYHSYASLFKAWFGGDVDHKIIESAIVFWFKDDDYEGNQKLWEHFKNK